MDLTEELSARYRELYRAMIAKDIPALDALLDGSFVLRHMTGMQQSKASFLDAVSDGTLNYYTADHEHITAKIDSGSAVLVGQSRVHAAVFGGGRSTWRLQLTITFNKVTDAWLMTKAEASTY